MPLTRHWMTGCMALVLLLAGRMPVRMEEDADQRSGLGRITLASRFGLDETTRLIERQARALGLSIVARAPQVAPPGSGQAADGAAGQVLVWGDASGQTPAMQTVSDALPVLPWQLWIRPGRNGGTEVSLLDPESLPLPEGVSEAMGRKARLWPEVLRRALS